MTLNALVDYVNALRLLLAGQTAIVDGKPTRMLHADGLAAPRPIDVPLWLSVFGPPGQRPGRRGGRRDHRPSALHAPGQAWREALEALAPEDQRHLLTFEGHVTHLPDRDRRLLEHIDLVGDADIDVTNLVGDATHIGKKLARFADFGFNEIIYTPAGPDVARELKAFASAHHHSMK